MTKVWADCWLKERYLHKNESTKVQTLGEHAQNNDL